jgi:DNA-binding NtrC family response regulator
MKPKTRKQSLTSSRSPLRSYKELRKEVLRRFEVDYVWRLLKSTRGNISEAARTAKIDRKHLWRIMRRAGIRVEHVDTRAKSRR